jgi:hypothetical protein
MQMKNSAVAADGGAYGEYTQFPGKKFYNGKWTIWNAIN